MKYKRLLCFGFMFLLCASSVSAGGDKWNMDEILVHHLMDAVVVEWNVGGRKVRPGSPEFDKDTEIGGVVKIRSYVFRDEQGLYRWEGGLPLHITKRVAMMFMVSLILLIVMISAARIIAANPYRVNNRFAGMIEAMVQFIRQDVVATNMHSHARGFEAYILSLFFFILFGNLLGLVPSLGEIANEIKIAITGHRHAHLAGDPVSPLVGLWPGITITGDVAVTFTLSAVTVLMVWITGFRYQGIKFLWSFMPKGFPPVLAVIMYPILFPLLFLLEIVIGPLVKGFALTIRLLANMTAGHVVILAILGFIFQFGLALAPISVLGAGAIYVLEIFVAFLQAFIFAFLTTLFIGQSMHAH